MAEFKEILRFERVDESGNVLQAEDIDLRRGIVGEEAPTENTPGMAGLMYYVVKDGKITSEYVCVAAKDGVYTWKKKESGTGGVTVDDTLTVHGAAADAKVVGDKLAEVSKAIKKLDVQPDWNQNDSTAKDYVKNRPFWMDDPVEKTVIPEMTDVWEKNQTILEPIEIIPGAVYKIYWDGTLYECTAYLIDSFGYVIGNGTLINGSEFSGGNGEPFLLVTLEGKFTFVIAEQDGEHTIKIDAVIAEVHKIDRSFLPSATDAEPGIISTHGIQYSVIDIENSYYIGSGEYELVTYSEFNKYLSSKALPTLNVHVKKKSSDSDFHVMFVVTDVSRSIGGIDGTTSINVHGLDYINNNITGLKFVFPEDNKDTHEVAADATLFRIDYQVRDDFLIKNNRTVYSVKIDDAGNLAVSKFDEGVW